MKSLNELITEAQQKLDEIALHSDFVALVEADIWDDPSILVDDIRRLLSDLQRIHNLLIQETS